MILIWNLRAALHLDLERFFDKIGACDEPHRTAFSKARSFLKDSAFIEINEQINQVALDLGLRDNLWRGLRLLAMDGSTLRLPKGSPEIDTCFGGLESRHGTFLPMARMSYLFEVRTGLILSAQLSPLEVGERSQAHELLGESVWESDCVLYDRGYNDPRIIAWTLAQDSHFVMRVAVGGSKAAQDFVDGGANESGFDYRFSDDVVNEFEDYGLEIPKACRLRFIRVPLKTGEVEVLLTNLTDRENYPADEFEALYHERWTVEEGIKTTKCKIEVENWTGKTATSVKQDFHARIVCQNIAVILALASQPILDQATVACKHAYKINIKRAIGVIRDQFIVMMTGTKQALQGVVETLSVRLPRSASIVRPERSFPRGTPRRIPVSQPYKPIA